MENFITTAVLAAVLFSLAGIFLMASYLLTGKNKLTKVSCNRKAADGSDACVCAEKKLDKCPSENEDSTLSKQTTKPSED